MLGCRRMQTLLAISLSMSIDEEGKSINKNKQKEKVLIIGMECQEKMVAFLSIGILRTDV